MTTEEAIERGLLPADYKEERPIQAGMGIIEQIENSAKETYKPLSVDMLRQILMDAWYEPIKEK